MTTPFDNLTNNQKEKLYKRLGTHIYLYTRDEEILSTLKGGNIIGIILSGHAQICNIEYNGNVIIREDLYKDDIFGTNISATHFEDHIIMAKEATTILLIDYNNLVKPSNLVYKYYNTFLYNLFDIINEKFLKANERIKVLEEKQIRNRIIMYFKILYSKTNNKVITLPFSRKKFADYLAVNRTALLRELKSLKDEHLIEIKGREITLMYI